MAVGGVDAQATKRDLALRLEEALQQVLGDEIGYIGFVVVLKNGASLRWHAALPPNPNPFIFVGEVAALEQDALKVAASVGMVLPVPIPGAS